jgi:hypothetical protein
VCYCFDRAIVTFGRHTENKLSERQKNGRPKYTLAQLLADPPKPGEKAGPRKITAGELLRWGLPVKVKTNLIP